MAKDKKNYSVLELPLVMEQWQKDRFNIKYDCVQKAYNNMLSDMLKKYHEMVKTREWRSLNDVIREELQKEEKTKSDRLKGAYARKNEIMRDNGFSEFGFIGVVTKYTSYYQKHISACMAALCIAKPMWAAFEKLFFGNGERVSFKKKGSVTKLSSDNKSGMVLRQDDNGKYYIRVSNMFAKAKPFNVYIKGPFTDYDRDMINRKVKVVSIIKNIEKGKEKFYCQLTVEGSPYVKRDVDGELKHTVSTGSVGLAIWRENICAVSDDTVYMGKLSVNVEEFEAKREALSRKIEHLRRINNPENYEDDGTIKKGIIGDDGKRHKLVWYESNSYKRAVAELKELYRKHDVEKKLLQNKIIWELLSMGSEFSFADTSFLNDKPAWDEENPLTNDEYKKKKKRRRAIQEYAPATFLTKLDMRLVGLGYDVVHRYKLPSELYWYRHDTGVSDEELFKGTDIVILDKLLNQTIYRAFLIRRFDSKLNVYQQKLLEEDFAKLIKNI